jgi:hypothetical protein
MRIDSYRTQLLADRTYYVRTDGNDNNDGSADDVAHAFLTIQAAYDHIIKILDLSYYNVTIKIGDGVYTSSTVLKPYVSGGGQVKIKGNLSNPDNVSIITSGPCFNAIENRQSPVWVQDMKLKSTASWCLIAEIFGAIYFQNLVFDTSFSGHIYCIYGSYMEMKGDYSVIGSAPYHIFVGDQAQAFISAHQITYSNNPVFSATNFVCGILSELQCAGLTFVNGNTVTGTRYNVFGNGVLQTNGGGANYIPGNSAGGSSTGGQCI